MCVVGRIPKDSADLEKRVPVANFVRYNSNGIASIKLERHE